MQLKMVGRVVVSACLSVLAVGIAWAVVFATPRPAESAAPLQVPAGFVDELVVGGLLNPRAVAWTPDGRLLILERGSASSDDENLASVRVFKNGQLLTTRALTLSVCGNGERGLLGIALDPGFSSNGYLYLYYSRQDQGVGCGTQNTWINGQPGPRNRVSRFTMTGDTISPSSELVLLDNIPTDVGIHNAGDMAFGPDGYLYVATGDSGLAPSPAAQLDNLAGKILRLLPQAGGYATDGNPYQTASGATTCGTIAGRAAGPCREIWAHGLRNPFRIGFQPGAGQLFVADVGGGAMEEVNLVLSGRNYGWPTCEGRCFPANAALTDPIYQYPHDGFNGSTDAAIIGGDFATHSSYPQPYQGGYFFADFNRRWVRYLKFENNT
jgi:glucose/arabinose dehydrogenase